MAAPKKKVYDLAALVESEVRKQYPIVFQIGGVEFTIPPPILWPDEVYTLQQTGEIVAAAHGLLGDQYEAFVVAGGSAAKLMAGLDQMTGATVPESEASTDS
jgi:hypothetical protein